MPRGQYDRERTFTSDYDRQLEIARLFKEMSNEMASVTLIKLQAMFRHPKVGKA